MIDHPRPVLLFTGKGGVGKTSVACATALGLADAGERVLLVSTDPASNLDEVLDCPVPDGAPGPVPGAEGLFALNIDPEAAARRYRERVVGPYRGVLPDATVAGIEEQLSGACTVEIAAFDQFARLLAADDAEEFDHVVFDTAPTGHTLRLLELPAAWTGFFDENTTGTSCLGPLSGLGAERTAYARALESLRDPDRTEVVIVTRPERASIREAERTSVELGELGVAGQRLVINGVMPEMAPGSGDPLARWLAQRDRNALAALPPVLTELKRLHVRLMPDAPLGLTALRRLASCELPAVGPHASVGSDDDGLPAALADTRTAPPPGFGFIDELVRDLETSGRGVILTMGKGGVGKTRVAAEVAIELARRGHAVHLTTTDPAAHVMNEVEGVRAQAPGENSAHPSGRMRVSRIDPQVEVRRYTEQVLAEAGASLDEAGRALLEEDLRSPCTEEIAVFQAFAAVVEEGEQEIVVIDTAPTGHTLLLMDAAEAYHREVLRKPGNAPEAVRRLLPRLRDPAFARVLLVTTPEATPVHEAARLQDDLARAGITPYAWVVNQCLTGLETRDPFLLLRQQGEARYLTEVQDLSRRAAVVPLGTGFAASSAPIPFTPPEPALPGAIS